MKLRSCSNHLLGVALFVSIFGANSTQAQNERSLEAEHRAIGLAPPTELFDTGLGMMTAEEITLESLRVQHGISMTIPQFRALSTALKRKIVRGKATKAEVKQGLRTSSDSISAILDPLLNQRVKAQPLGRGNTGAITPLEAEHRAIGLAPPTELFDTGLGMMTAEEITLESLRVQHGISMTIPQFRALSTELKRKIVRGKATKAAVKAALRGSSIGTLGNIEKILESINSNSNSPIPEDRISGTDKTTADTSERVYLRGRSKGDLKCLTCSPDEPGRDETRQ